MAKLILVFVLVTFTFSNASREDDDRGDLSDGDNDIPFSKLPSDVQVDVSTILNGDKTTLGGCSGEEPDYNKVELLLFANDTESYTRIDPTKPNEIDLNAPLYILAHGWLSGLNGYKIKAFRDKYIELHGNNVLFINWGKLAWYRYTKVYCNIPYMAQYIANFLCDLSVKYNYDLKHVHMIGHSFGAQFAGHTGKAVQGTCNKKMGKITGLDPAGPIYQFVSEEKRLAPTDAGFVEVVHTNSAVCGYLGRCGTVDYHLNCGTLQPGCDIPKDPTDNIGTSIYKLFCAHMRAVEIWPYVIESKDFKAKSCKLCPSVLPSVPCVTDRVGAHFISMGHTYTKSKRDSYNLVTGAESPYRLGCTPYPLQGCS